MHSDMRMVHLLGLDLVQMHIQLQTVRKNDLPITIYLQTIKLIASGNRVTTGLLCLYL